MRGSALDAEYTSQKRLHHNWLIVNDPDYKFECAVMGADATWFKYTLVELTVRRERLDKNMGASGPVIQGPR